MTAPFAIDRPEVVHQAVCEVLTGIFPTVSMEALLSSDRINATTAWVRQAGMYLMAARFAVGQSKAAQQWGRDRSTVSHAVQLASQEIERRPATAAFFDFLEQQVRSALDRYAAVEAEWGSV